MNYFSGFYYDSYMGQHTVSDEDLKKVNIDGNNYAPCFKIDCSNH